MTIGRRSDTGFSFNGDLDETVLYTNALTAAEVLAHYENGINPTPTIPYEQLVQGKNPAGYWRLNEPAYTAPDPSTLPVAVNSGSAGAAAEGRYSVYSQPGAPAANFGGFGAGNYACNFSPNGLPTSVILGNPAELNFTGQITLMAWVKPQATDGLRNIISHGYRSTPDQELQLRISSGAYDVGSWSPGEGVSSPAGMATADIGLWTFVAGTYDGTKWSLYRNGALVATNAGPLGAVLVEENWAIGARGTGTERFFQGGIDEVAILTNALSAAQILQLYNSANVPPFFTKQPQAPVGNVYEGMTVSLDAQAGGVLPLAYQWTKNTTNLVGKTATNLVLLNVKTSDSGNYALVVTNNYGAVTSSIIALNVQAGPPVIFQAPQSLTKYVGGNPLFQVVAGGSVPLSYQWKFGTNVLAGQTNASLHLANVQPADAGSYSVLIANSYGSTNLTATLTLVQPANYAAAVMANRPRAYWRMNETSGTVAADWSGSYDGTYVGIVTNNVPSVQAPTYLGYETTNTGYQFSGGRAYVETPALGFTNNTFTIAFWANPVSPQADSVPFMFTGGSTNGGFGVNLDGGPALRHHYADNGPSGWWQSSGLEVSWDTWNYIVLVIEPSQATFYLDKGDGNGLQSSVVAGTHVPMPFNLPCYISRESRDMRYFKGPMDEVALFDRALSASDVLSLHTMAISGPLPPAIVKQPVPVTRYVGSSATFSIEAVGVPPLAYQWKTNGTPVAGATNGSLTLANVQMAQNGIGCSVTVSTSAGATNSEAAVLTVLSHPAGYAGALLGYGPVAYWRLDEPTGSTTAYDYAGGFDGEDQGGLNPGVAGPQSPAFPGFSAGNTAAQFDGSSAQILTSPAMGLNTNTVTITCWVKRNGPQIDFAGLVFTRGGQVSGLDMKPNGELRYHWNNVRYDWSSGLIAPDGQWAFVALVVEPTKATMYMDAGTGLVSAVDNVAHANCTFDQVRLGIDPTARFFNGDLDEAAVFNRALSLDEITTLHAAAFYGSTTKPFFTRQPASQPIVVGSTLTLTAAVFGSMPINYQWKNNGVIIPGSTSASLTLSNIYYTSSGNYVLYATNGAGWTNSATATVTVMPVPTYANATNALVLHLAFENNPNDTSGRGNHATAMNAPTYVTGKVGSKALHYNTDTTTSTYSYAQIANTNDFQFGEAVDFSVAYWVKFTGKPGDLPFIATATGSYGGAGLTFAPGYQTGTWSYSLGGATAGVATGYGMAVVNDDQWHSLVHSFTRTGNAVTYLDGVPVDSRSIAGIGSLDSLNPLTIGQDPTGTYAVTGSADIDDVGIWSRALTAYEASGIYNAAQSGLSFDVQAPVKLYLNKVGGNIDLSWQAGTLLQSTTVNGPYSPVSGATAPFYRTSPTNSAMFYRVRN